MLAKLMLSVVSFVLFFGACELAVRAVGPDLSTPQAPGQFQFTQTFETELPHHLRDAELGWRLAPGVYGRMHVNEDGFRGRPLAEASPEGLRIAHLGDSCTMGFTVGNDHDIYAARLERALASKGIEAETFNFGVDGYTSHQGRILLDEVLASVEPDYVTFYFGYNDHHWSNAPDRDAPWRVPAWQALLESSHGFRFLRRQLLRLTRQEARLVEPQRRVDADSFEQNLLDMVATAAAAGAIPLLITTPLRPHVPLIENEVLAVIDGQERWVGQGWWVDAKLRELGVPPGQALGSPVFREVLREGLREHPDWPWLHWLQAQELELQGKKAAARAARRRARALDAERRLMSEYNDRVRRVGEATGAPVVDLAASFPPQQPLFNDVVHPDVNGHAKIAGALAAVIAERESASDPE